MAQASESVYDVSYFVKENLPLVWEGAGKIVGGGGGRWGTAVSPFGGHTLLALKRGESRVALQIFQ